MLHTGGVDVVTNNLSGIVEANGLSGSRAGEIHIAEGAGTVRKAVPYACQVVERADDQASGVDARRDAERGARDCQSLIGAAREGKRCCRRRGASGIEHESADRGAAIRVENQRLRSARIVHTRVRIDLRDSQRSSHGLIGGDRKTFDRQSWS